MIFWVEEADVSLQIYVVVMCASMILFVAALRFVGGAGDFTAFTFLVGWLHCEL